MLQEAGPKDDDDICPWMKTYHVSFVPKVPLPSSPKEKAAAEIPKLYPTSLKKEEYSDVSGSLDVQKFTPS